MLNIYDRYDNEVKFGVCCNACVSFYDNNDKEPCMSCTGGLDEKQTFTNFTSCSALLGAFQREEDIKCQ